MDFLIHHMLRTSARRSPDDEALVHGGQRLSHRDVERRISGLGEDLSEVGQSPTAEDLRTIIASLLDEMVATS